MYLRFYVQHTEHGADLKEKVKAIRKCIHKCMKYLHI